MSILNNGHFHDILPYLTWAFSEPSALAVGGHDAPHHNFVFIASMIINYATDMKLGLFPTMVTKHVVTPLLLSNYDVITCILADG